MSQPAPTIWIGTSGFQYPEWKGTFYPADLSTAKMLPYYAERLSTTEINYTFRQIPKSKTLQNWLAATPTRFRFSLKAPQRITHFAKLRDCAEILRFFHSVVTELGERLGPVLFQLPPNFRCDVQVLEAFLQEIPQGMRAAFEFRHESWLDDRVYAALRRGNAALCIAESSDFSTPQILTADFAYLRLRREDYQPADLERWAGFVRRLPGNAEAFVYFKHEESGVGPKFAQHFMELTGTRAPGN